MQDLSVHNSPKLNSPREKSAGARLAWQSSTTRKTSETNGAVNTAVIVITNKPNRTRLSNASATQSNRNPSRAIRSNRTRSSKKRGTRSTRIRKSNAIGRPKVAELETKRSETNADGPSTRTRSSNTNGPRSKRTPLLITQSTWTGRTRLTPIVEFHNHKHGHGSAPITRATRCEREKSKQQSTCFMENHLLHQLRQLFSKICDEHKQSRGSDDDLEVLRTHIHQVESHLADVRDLKPDRDNFNQQLTNQCAVFVDLNSKAIAACMEFRSRSRL